MLTIKPNTDGTLCTVTLAGRLDTTTAPELEEALNGILGAAKNLVFDIEDLLYVSSAGLRVFLMMQKDVMKKGGSMKVLHPTEDVREIFSVTGFTEFLTIE